MTRLIYKLLGVAALWTDYIHCQLTLYQASGDIFDIASATFQEVGVVDDATTYIYVLHANPSEVISETMVVSASGFSESTNNTLLGLIVTGGCQFVAATSVSCDIGNVFNNDIAVGTPIAFEVAVETMLVTSQSPGFPFPSPTPSVFASSTIAAPLTDLPSFAISTPTATPSSSVVSDGASKKSKSSTAVIGGVTGGILLLSLIFLICWFVRRRQAKQAYSEATRATIYP
ncbi:hypothetical protein BDP27DRAFT_1370100 [Rhodocollybia butyracea]|uniref:Mid2 domain-containing protein n=1 Tax=Rhodocollybia butyracea TaxID=206335 RepID=A0A9P5U007_9AGAR|nr:hypothetical protein BDP27DRAFT_1370100 [Rhodocollybia butyracea]